MKIRKTSSFLSRNRFISVWVLVLSIASTFLFARSHYMFNHPKEGHLVYMAGNGKLGYKYYANEGESQEINRIPDFSFCGYEKGGVSLPHVGEQIRISPKAGDNLNHVQSAINNLSSYPIGPDGYRGAIVLEAGQYHVNGTIIINASGIVLRGEGQDESGTCLIATGRYDHDFMKFSGERANPYEIEASIRNITDQYVPVGSTEINVNSSDPFVVGDRIAIVRTPNQLWVDDLDMAQYWWEPSYFKIPHERKIVGIQDNVLEIDIPMVDAIQSKYGGGYVTKINTSERIHHCGLENMVLKSAHDENDPEDEEHAWNAIYFRDIEHSWIKGVTGKHFAKSLIEIDRHANFNTIQDCAMVDHVSKIRARRRYSFDIREGSCNLFQRCYTRDGRHDFVTVSKVEGPNVWLDCLAENTHDDIGPHGRWCTGILFDNILGGSIRLRNRRDGGSDFEGDMGQGWSCAQNMLWNVISTEQSIVVESPIGGKNWAMGYFGHEFKGNGYWENRYRFMVPRSLYLQQLQDRLGVSAVENITISEQRAGQIFHLLREWEGNGSLADFSTNETQPRSSIHDPRALKIHQYWITVHLVTWNVVALLGVMAWKAKR